MVAFFPGHVADIVPDPCRTIEDILENSPQSRSDMDRLTENPHLEFLLQGVLEVQRIKPLIRIAASFPLPSSLFTHALFLPLQKSFSNPDLDD